MPKRLVHVFWKEKVMAGSENTKKIENQKIKFETKQILLLLTRWFFPHLNFFRVFFIGEAPLEKLEEEAIITWRPNPIFIRDKSFPDDKVPVLGNTSMRKFGRTTPPQHARTIFHSSWCFVELTQSTLGTIQLCIILSILRLGLGEVAAWKAV